MAELNGGHGAPHVQALVVVGAGQALVGDVRDRAQAVGDPRDLPREAARVVRGEGLQFALAVEVGQLQVVRRAVAVGVQEQVGVLPPGVADQDGLVARGRREAARVRVEGQDVNRLRLAVVPDEVRVAVAVVVHGRQDPHVVRLEHEGAEVGGEPGAGVDLQVGDHLPAEADLAHQVGQAVAVEVGGVQPVLAEVGVAPPGAVGPGDVGAVDGLR